MLKLNNIIKDYKIADTKVRALDGVSIEFRRNEFVSILGHSGCGKTTLLNIIGGLDRYTDGDIVIDGISTTEYKDSDWDAYRNRRIGFVFQNYNLIPHQTVLANVELALTLQGVSKTERRKRAIEALESVGLGDQLQKKPNQMSGGQMQRVAIARALVNDPEILLADEPTGALDTATSVQIMDILKSIAEKKLIIMVTHNPELAEQYSTRIVKLLDGKIVSDSMPYTEETDETESAASSVVVKKKKAKKRDKTSMSFATALGLSFNNLLTKKGRSILTSFAGSIGIIGIALILSLSNGINIFINKIQQDTLSSYPIKINREEPDLSAMLSSFADAAENSRDHDMDKIYQNTVMYNLFNNMNEAESSKNNLVAFKEFIENRDNEINDYITSVKYSYDMPMNFYAQNSKGKYVQADVNSLMSGLFSSVPGMGSYSSMMNSSIAVWDELISDRQSGKISSLVYDQYDLLYGDWPKDKTELVLVLDKNNEISDYTLFALGLITTEEMMSNLNKAMLGEPLPTDQRSWTYEEMCARTFKLIPTPEFFKKNDKEGTWSDIREDETQSATVNMIVSGGLDIKIVGVIKPNEDATSTSISGSIGYTRELTEYIIEKTQESPVIKEQLENPDRSVITGLPFSTASDSTLTDKERADAFREYISRADDKSKAAMLYNMLTIPSEDAVKAIIDSQIAPFLKENNDGKTEDELVTMIVESIKKIYVEQMGMDETLVNSIIGQYKKYDALIKLVSDTLHDQAEASLKANGEKQYKEITEAPTKKELDFAKVTIEQSFPQPLTKETKIGFIMSNNKDLPAESFAVYLMTLGDEDFQKIYDSTLEAYAREYLAASSSLIKEDTKNKKAADHFDAIVEGMTDEELAELFDTQMNNSSDLNREQTLITLGMADESNPRTIIIYADTFEDKDAIGREIDAYNAAANDGDKITYTDIVKALLSSVTIIINAISYVLVSFVSISLIVSSIMIGIITYISVLERTKEIGILRAVGASKRDVKQVFNAETLIIGLGAGAIGIIITLILIIPINIIIRAVTGIGNIGASLPPVAGIALVIISMALTIFAGLIPSSMAAKKDPVEALRSE